jgi:2-hydroxychromene-2-carboxylate isomerase
MIRPSISSAPRAAICGETWPRVRSRKASAQAAAGEIFAERLKAARLALAGVREGWTPSFTRAVFAANYAEQKDISEEATLRAILSALDVDAEAALAAANTPENKDALRRQTEEAASRGLFGAPSFTIGDELFWCNDRLESALAWAKHA